MFDLRILPELERILFLLCVLLLYLGYVLLLIWLLIVGIYLILFIGKCDMLVMTLLVRFLNMSLPLIIKLLTNILFVSHLRNFYYLLTNNWVFRNHLFMEERLTKRNTINPRHRHINELRFLITTHIVIAKVRVSLSLDPNFKLFFWKALIHQIITDTHNAILYEIHFFNFGLFI